MYSSTPPKNISSLPQIKMHKWLSTCLKQHTFDSLSGLDWVPASDTHSVLIDVILSQDFQHLCLSSGCWKMYTFLHIYIVYGVPLDLHVGYQDTVFNMSHIKVLTHTSLADSQLQLNYTQETTGNFGWHPRIPGREWDNSIALCSALRLLGTFCRTYFCH